MNTLERSWTPTSDTVDIHEQQWEPSAGGRSSLRVMFASPPSCIGRVQVADSSLCRDERATSLAAMAGKWLVAVGVLAGVGAVFGALGAYVDWVLALPLLVLLPLTFMVIVFGPYAVWIRNRFRRYCGFIGEQGFAFFMTNTPDGEVRRQYVVRFDETDVIRPKQKVVTLLGDPAGVGFDFRWKAKSGRTLARFRGGYQLPGTRIVGYLSDPNDAFVHAFIAAAARAFLEHALSETSVAAPRPSLFDVA
jgi:hypothetical protein